MLLYKPFKNYLQFNICISIENITNFYTFLINFISTIYFNNKILQYISTIKFYNKILHKISTHGFYNKILQMLQQIILHFLHKSFTYIFSRISSLVQLRLTTTKQQHRLVITAITPLSQSYIRVSCIMQLQYVHTYISIVYMCICICFTY